MTRSFEVFGVIWVIESWNCFNWKLFQATALENEKIKKLNAASDEQVKKSHRKLEFHRLERASICSNLKKIEKLLKSTHEIADVKTEELESLERKNETKTIRDKLKQIDQIRENIKTKQFQINDLFVQVSQIILSKR